MHVALQLSARKRRMEAGGFQPPVNTAAPRGTNIFRHRGAVAFWIFNLTLKSAADGQALKSQCRRQESPVRSAGFSFGKSRRRASGPDQTASFATFSGEALTDLLAGFAANCIGSLVKGLTPMRASVAGLLTTDIFTKPGTTNSPDSLSSL